MRHSGWNVTIRMGMLGLAINLAACGASVQSTGETGPGPAYKEMKIAGLDVAVWRSLIKGAPSPPILFSHGFNGCNTQSTFLMEALAKAGYTVFAPNHKDASCNGGGFHSAEISFNESTAWTDQTYRDRQRDLAALTDALRTSPEWRARLDWKHAGLAGHSLGGYTVLGLAGAWPSWRQTTFKAVLALSPYCDPYVKSGRLGQMTAPVMYQGGTWDFSITPTVKGRGGCFDKSSSPAWFVEFDAAWHFSWTDLDPRFHGPINQYSIAFFNAYLKNKGTGALKIADPAVIQLLSK
jgi:predicted dienelactone hydrolase